MMFILVPLFLYINAPINPLIEIQVFWHDVKCYVSWFVTWGVLCHLTVTKILKSRCGWHTPRGPRDVSTTPHRDGYQSGG